MIFDRTKQRAYFLLPFLLILLFFASLAAAEIGLPRPAGAINDFAGVIDAASARMMENLSREVLEKTGTAIVVAVVASIEDNDPDDYANRLYQAWGIGEKGKDKGVLLFLALKERKVRIETGYGVEGILPDGKVGEILDRYVLPDLKAGQYGQGLTRGVIAVASVIAKDAQVELTGAPALTQPRVRHARRGSGLLPLLFLPILFLLLGTRRGRAMLPLILLMMLGSGRGGGYGGGGGGFGGGFGGFGGGLSGGGGAGRSF